MVINADCIEHMNTMPPDSVDSIVTDPPYHLTSIVKRFGKEGSAPAQFGTDGAYARASRGFMGKEWDGGDIAFRTEVWEAALRVAKPGAYLLAFGGTRTFHRMAVAIEGMKPSARSICTTNEPPSYICAVPVTSSPWRLENSSSRLLRSSSRNF